MINLKISVQLLLAFLLVSNVNCDWSWGASHKVEAALEAETDGLAPEAIPSAVSEVKAQNEPRSASIDVPQAVLPLEENRGDYVALEIEQETEDQEFIGDEGRSSRFLGIPDRLCKLGVKGLCDKQKQGYPPIHPGYGNSIPSQGYNSYAPNVYPPLNGGYPGGPNFITPKPSKGLFSNLFKNKKKDTFKATYIPPPTYGAPKPSYAAPQPVYKPLIPSYPPKPVYQPPVHSYSQPKPKPLYHSPVQKVSYQQPIHTFDTPKPNDVIIHQIKGQHSIPKHIISSAAHPGKVQHVHTHTHIYQQNQGFDIRDNYNLPRDDGSYQSASQVQAVKTTIHNAVPFSSINTDKVYIPQAKEKTTFTGSFKPSQEIPFAGISTNQGKRHISSTTNAFNSFGLKNPQHQQVQQHQINQQQQSQHQFNQHQQEPQNQVIRVQQAQHQFNQHQQPQNQNNQLQQSQHQFNQHQQSQNQINQLQQSQHSINQHQQSFQTSIDKLTASFAKNGLQNAYPEDCQCVPRQYCSPEDLVGRTDTKEIRHLLDARNEPSAVISNSTLPADYYDYDYLHSNLTYDDDLDYTTVEPEVTAENETTTESLSTEATPTTTTTTKPEEKLRTRRETKEENKNSTEDLQGRQLTGFSPGLNGCGPDYVCCRRPVYIAAKRSGPICGRGNPSIHGRVASFEYEKGQSDFGEYPWQAAILRDEGPESMFVCGATLIDDRHILTAAHCVNDLKVETLKVRLGEWDVNRDTEFYNYVEDRVSGIFVHPEFYKGNLYNDIAVIRLANYVDIDSHPHVSPICLPPPNTDFTNHRCHVTGWGKDAFGDKGKFQHILKELEIPVVDHKTCEFALRSTRLGRDYKLHKGFICAGGEEGKDACKGDGGGPLVCVTSSKTFQLAGVVSWGIGCGQKNIPGIYVNIPYYVDWIRSTTSIL